MFKHLLNPTSHQLSQLTSIKYCHTTSARRMLNRTFQDEMKIRFDEAKRSVLVETPSLAYNHLIDHCSRFGRIEKIFAHETTAKNYYLIEYANISSSNACLSNGKTNESDALTKSRFFRFENSNSGFKKRNVLNKSSIKEKHTLDPQTIMKYMSSVDDSDKQIQALYEINTISGLSQRLRFLTALQIEEAASVFFPHCKVIPFGSSVNGFGRMSSDLDMVLIYGKQNREENSLRFLYKSSSMDRSQQGVRNNLQILSHIMRNWLAGISKLDPILNARVPIVKFHQDFTGLDCDLSMANISGHHMSDIFFTIGQIDNRVRPLVLYIRRWAEECGIIRNIQPSPHITNFMMTCLVIFFLQRLKHPVLPPIKEFSPNLTHTNAEYITDISTLKFKSENTDSLSTLLKDFFTFYSIFNFEKNGICIANGRIKPNSNRDSLLIYNPLERSLNVCRNVIDYERDKFIEKSKLALHALNGLNYDAVQLLQSCTINDNEKKRDVSEFVDSITKSNVTINVKV